MRIKKQQPDNTFVHDASLHVYTLLYPLLLGLVMKALNGTQLDICSPASMQTVTAGHFKQAFVLWRPLDLHQRSILPVESYIVSILLSSVLVQQCQIEQDASDLSPSCLKVSDFDPAGHLYSKYISGLIHDYFYVFV